MQRVLLKRTFRDLKANFLRYLALLLLIVLCVSMIVGIVGSSQSVIWSINASARENLVEDGEFSVFIPLTDQETQSIEGMGVVLEENFYLDFSMADSSTLRMMKNRRSVNLVALSEGCLPETDTQVVIERIYAVAHGLSVGDTVEIGGISFEICGIGTTPDYDCCYENLSDMSADGQAFGTAFVSDEAYGQLKNCGQALHSEEYYYSYRLTGDSTEAELKEYLQSLTVSSDAIDNVYFQEMLTEETADRDKLTDAIASLLEGADDLNDAAATLHNSINELREGTTELTDGSGEYADGLGEISDCSDSLTSASQQIYHALSAIESVLDETSGEFDLSSLSALPDTLHSLSTGLGEISSGLQQLSSGYTQAFGALKSALESLPKTTVSEEELAALREDNPDSAALQTLIETYSAAKTVQGTYEQAFSVLSGLSATFDALSASTDTATSGIDSLSSGLESALSENNMTTALGDLQSAISSLVGEYAEFDAGLSDYTDGVSQLVDAYAAIENGISSLDNSVLALSDGTTELSDGAEQMSEQMGEFQNGVDDFLEEYFSVEISNMIDFVPAQDNPRIGASADDAVVNVNVGLLAGVIVLLLIAYVISVFVIHSIDRESEVIGALYALGVKGKQLVPQYTMLPVFLCLLGGILGTALGYSKASVSFFTADTVSYYSIAEIRTYYAPLLLLYGAGVPPVIAFVVNTGVIHKRLSQTALSLLRKERKPEKVRRRANAKPEKRGKQSKAGFIRTFQFRQLLREKRSLFALFAGLFVSLLVLMIGLNCYVLCENLWANNRSDVTYGYQYIYKYPTDEVPEGGYEAYTVTLKKEVLGYNMEIQVIGLTDTNPYFPEIPKMEQDEIVLAASTASKYGLGVGDQLILNDDVNETYYYFTVKEIVDYSVGLSAFMNIDNMRKLFCVDEDYYNVVYSDTALDIDAGRLYSVSTGEDVAESAEIFIKIMSSMIYSMIFGAVAILLIVMYQMVKVMLDRSAQHISLLKIFGYKDREIRRLYLDGNFLMLAVTTPFLIALAKQIMDCIYPYLVSNVACGIYLTWEPWLYITVYAAVLLCFLLIRGLLMVKIRRNRPAEVLKNRE